MDRKELDMDPLTRDPKLNFYGVLKGYEALGQEGGPTNAHPSQNFGRGDKSEYSSTSGSGGSVHSMDPSAEPGRSGSLPPRSSTGTSRKSNGVGNRSAFKGSPPPHAVSPVPTGRLDDGKYEQYMSSKRQAWVRRRRGKKEGQAPAPAPAKEVEPRGWTRAAKPKGTNGTNQATKPPKKESRTTSQIGPAPDPSSVSEADKKAKKSEKSKRRQ